MLYAYKNNALVSILFAAAAIANPLQSRSPCQHKVQKGHGWQLNLYGGINCNEAAPGIEPSNIFHEAKQPCMQTYGGLHKAESLVFSVASGYPYSMYTYTLTFYKDNDCTGKGYHIKEGAYIEPGAPMLSPLDDFYKKHFNGAMPGSFQVLFAETTEW